MAVWLAKKRGTGVRQISIVAKGEELTQGFIGPNGSINQPTYDWVKVRVDKPPTKLMYSTSWGHIDGDTTKPKIKYGVVYYSAEDDGRRTYDYKDTKGATAKRNAKVLPFANEGYYLVHYVADAKSYHNGVGMPDPYSGTGIKGWFIKTPDNRNYSDNLDKAKDTADEWWDAKTAPPPTPTPDDDDDGGLDPLQPSLPTFPADSGGFTAPMGVEASQAGETEEVDIQVEELVINTSAFNNRVGGDKTSFFGNRTGGI